MPRTPINPLPTATVGFTLAARDHGVHITPGQEHLFDGLTWQHRGDGRVRPFRYEVTRLGHVTAPFSRRISKEQRAAIVAPDGRVLIGVETPLLAARILASRANDGELATVLAYGDPWALMVKTAADALAEVAPQDQHRRIVKAAFFTMLVGGKCPGAMLPVGLESVHIGGVIAALASRFRLSMLWLNHDAHVHGSNLQPRWRTVEAAAAALSAELLEAAHEVVLDAPGNAHPVLVDVSEPIVEVDADAADEVAATLRRTLRLHVVAAAHVPTAPTVAPTVHVTISRTLTGVAA